MSRSSLTDADVQAILKLLSAADHLAEFRIRSGDIEIAYSRNGSGATLLPAPASTALAPAAAASPAPVAAAPAAPAPLAAAAAPTPLAGTQVASPMFGTFYRAPAPGAPPFVEVGQAVEPDTVVCIIEVMKLMNSVTAGVRGTVRQVLVADSQPVELGQPLVVIEPAA